MDGRLATRVRVGGRRAMLTAVPTETMPTELIIEQGGLDAPAVRSLLEEHLDDMAAVSPPESRHALSLDGLRHPSITFYSAWVREALAGCGALKELNPSHGEIKSMRTAHAFRRRGVAAHLLLLLLDTARQRGYGRISLETGSQPEFEPARALYRAHGFRECQAFGEYVPDPNSTFMTLELRPR